MAHESKNELFYQKADIIQSRLADLVFARSKDENIRDTILSETFRSYLPIIKNYAENQDDLRQTIDMIKKMLSVTYPNANLQFTQADYRHIIEIRQLILDL